MVWWFGGLVVWLFGCLVVWLFGCLVRLVWAGLVCFVCLFVCFVLFCFVLLAWLLVCLSVCLFVCAFVWCVCVCGWLFYLEKHICPSGVISRADRNFTVLGIILVLGSLDLFYFSEGGCKEQGLHKVPATVA